MKRIIYAVVLMMYPLLLACSDHHKKSDILKQANDTHLQSMTIAKELEEKLLELRKKQPDLPSVKKIDSLANMIELWESAVIEVPGFEHHHDHSGHHDHKPVPDMTDQSMLEYQISAKEAIMEVRMQVENLTKTINNR